MSEQINSSQLAHLEAILFSYGEPMKKEKLFSLLGVDFVRGEKLCREFASCLQEENRGLMLFESGDTLALATKPAFGSLLEDIVKEELKEDLTPAATEALSLIAYFGPISRPEIDYIRGVNSSFILRTLLMRGLIEREQGRGNAYAYHVGVEFLKHMGVSRAQDLPHYEEYRKIRDKYFDTITEDPQGAS